MSQVLAELFASFGLKVDEASFKKYDEVTAKSKKETDELGVSYDKMIDRVIQLSKERAQAASRSRQFFSAAEDVGVLKRKGNAALAASVVGLPSPVKNGGGEEDAASLGTALLKLDAAMNIVGRTAGFVKGQIGGMLADIKAAGGAAGDIADMSERTGIATDTLQELGYAAAQNGGDINSIGAALKSISGKALAAAKGSKEAQSAFTSVGISAGNIRSGALPLDAALEKIADRFADMPDGAKKSALAVKLFGGAGEKLIPFLNVGKDGIKALRKEAVDLGVVLEEKGLRGLDAFDDQSAKLTTTVKALKTQALAAIVPQLAKVAEKFQAWLGSNRARAVETITAAFKGLVSIIEGTASVVEAAIPAFVLVAENLDTVAAAIGGLVVGLIAYNAWTAITTAGSIKAAAAAAAAWLAAAGPFILLGVAVAAVIRFWPQIKSAAVAAGRAVKSAFVSAGQAVRDAWNYVVKLVSDKVDWVMDKVNKAVDAIKRAYKFFAGGSDRVGEKLSRGVNPWTSRSASNFGLGPSTVQRTAATTNNSTKIDVNSPITVNVGDNAKAQEVSKSVKRGMQNFWDQKMREFE